jgi:ligand-binding sensor domain-containing protein
MKGRYFYFLLPALWWHVVTGQVPYNHVFSVDKEMRNLRVHALSCDTRGLLWVGTTEGLYRYDGFRFSRQRTRAGAVTAMQTAPGGTVWIGFGDGSLGRVSGDSLVLVRRGSGRRTEAILCIATDRKGRTWYGTNGEGLHVLAGDTVLHFSPSDGLPDPVVYVLLEDASGRMLAGTDQGIGICTLNGKDKQVLPVPGNDKLPDSIVRSLLLDNDRLLIGTQDLGLFAWDFAAGDLVREFPDRCGNYGCWRKLIRSGRVLYAATDKGLVKVDLDTGKKRAENATGIASRITDLLFDAEGNLWVADNNGLYRSSDEKIQFLSVAGGERLTFVHTVLADSKGRLWYSPDQGLRCLESGEDGQPHLKSFTVVAPDKLIDIVTLCEDPYGNIWIGTVGDGIYRLRPSDGSVRKVQGDRRLDNASILSIARQGNAIWVAGFEGTFQFRLNAAEDFTVRAYSDDGPLKNKYVYHVFPDSRGRTWFALDGQGLLVLENGTFRQYTTENGLAGNVVYSITEDRAGNIWASTADAGLSCFDGKRFRNYSMEQGLSDLSVASVASDRYGNILAVSASGIDILRPGDTGIDHIGTEYGITDINPDANAVSTDPGGRLWIGTEKGIIRYSPEANAATRPMSCYILQARLFLSPVDTTIQRHFAYDENNFSFDFLAPHYSNPEAVSYRYRLEGLSPEWNVTKERTAMYPKLPPGRYRFRVEAALGSDFSRSGAAVFDFVVSAPFWTTWWFRLAALATLGLALAAYIRQREQQLRRVERLQQEKIHFQFEMLKNQVNPHFLFNSFNTLISFIEENPRVAVEYVEHLSALFRNIVTYREQDVISLEEELTVVRNYSFIQKKRYGDPFRLTIEVDETSWKKWMIPPLTLQLLIENAVKHNAVSRETPLHVRVFQADHILVVENNINPKFQAEPSSGLGLENVRSRYRLLTTRAVEIIPGNEYFRVKLPLIPV